MTDKMTMQWYVFKTFYNKLSILDEDLCFRPDSHYFPAHVTMRLFHNEDTVFPVHKFAVCGNDGLTIVLW